MSPDRKRTAGFEIVVHRSAIHDATWTAVFHGGAFDQSHMIELCGPLRVVQRSIRNQFGPGRFERQSSDAYLFVGGEEFRKAIAKFRNGGSNVG